MLVLKLVYWGAFASTAGWIYWAGSQRLDADLFFGLACAAGSFVLGALFVGLDGIVARLDALSPGSAIRYDQAEVSDRVENASDA